MMPLPWEAGPTRAYRLDQRIHASSWDSGLGAAIAGGRWNPPNFPVVYCSADPSTAILEVAVHKGFHSLDTVPHVLTAALVADPARVHVVRPAEVPNPTWLRPSIVGRGQQAFGRALLERHPFVLIPSAVSEDAWNLLINPRSATGFYALEFQRTFALDTRLNPV